jgi:dTDP-3-amino-3,4,6-trideoxy-alpha-D-glucose transaminase
VRPGRSIVERLPQAAPHWRIARFRPEIDAAIAEMLASGNFVLGPGTERFEAQFAAYVGTSHCVGVASGTDAISLALRAMGIGAGDEVVTVARTAAGTATGIRAAGATIRFVDVEPSTRGMDPTALEAAIGPRTAAVVAVHLHGIPARIVEIAEIAKRHGVALVEDCAQAHGATVDGVRVGCFGDAAAFSFYPTKNLGCVGDGGAVVTDSAELAARVRRLRQFGWDEDRISTEYGANSRLDEIQAAILAQLLPHLDVANAERRAIAADFSAAFADLPIELPTASPGAVYHQFAIALDERDALARALWEDGIATAVHYPRGLHHEPAFAVAGLSLPVTERLARRMLSLPIQPEVAGVNRERIVAAVRNGIRQCRR